MAAVLFAAGCASSGGGCGSSCGGAFKSVDGQGHPIKFTGTRLDNVAQVRVTQAGFDFLDASHLNDIIAALNSSASGGFKIPCAGTTFDRNGNVMLSSFNPLVDKCVGSTGLRFTALIGDENFNGQCDANEGTPLYITFKTVTWAMDPAGQILKARLVAHIATGDLYIRTIESHSSSVLCGENDPIQARLLYDDELVGLPQQDTAIDLDLQFSSTPDGRLELNVTDASLAAILTNFQPGAIVIDGRAGKTNPPPATGTYHHDGCDASANGTYVTTENGGADLNCAKVFNWLSANCDLTTDNGGACAVLAYARDYLLNFLKNDFKTQIQDILRTQLDKARCQRSTDNQGKTVDCDGAHPCPADDDGLALTCSDGAHGVTAGVCVPQTAQNGAPPHNCEPVSLGISGELDVSDLTQKVGFPANTRLDLFAGLGSKSASANIKADGIQLSAMAGTAPASNTVALCVPPALALPDQPVPALDFDDPANKPAAVGSYAVGFSLSGAMLNRGFTDAYTAGMLCATLSNKTTSFISSGLFKTFLPSLGFVTGGRDVPMSILLRPTQAPFVRVGQNTVTNNPDGTTAVKDALLTLHFDKLDFDFYALVDERQVRLFTLQADVELPLALRTFSGQQEDELQPVLGDFSKVITGISALNNEILSDDPSVVQTLLGAAVKLAEPLLAGILKPIRLPSVLGLKFEIPPSGIVGVVPTADVVKQGYSHLAVYANITACDPLTNPCERYTVKTQAHVVRQFVPADAEAVRVSGERPEVEIEASALLARKGTAEFSYRIDNGLWSPWVAGPRITVRDPVFLFQGHHRIDVTAREAGDDHTMDRDGVGFDFLVSYEAPSAGLYQRSDGSVLTRAHSASTADAQLVYSYRIDGEPEWSLPGPARLFSVAELGGRALQVSVTDEAGHATQATFGQLSPEAALQAGTVGCGTSSRTPAWSLLPLAFIALAISRRRRA